MRTAHRLASLAKRATLAQPKAIPKFWRTSTSPQQRLDAQLIHWDLIDRFTSGTADRADLWDWMETGFTYSQLMRLLAEDGTEFTPEAIAQRHARTGRVGFNAAELLTARAAASVFDSLIELDRYGLAEKAAIWSTEQMAHVRRKMLAASADAKGCAA